MSDATQASREILWNLQHPANSLLMYAFLLLALAIGANGILAQTRLVLAGTPDPDRKLPFWQRFFDLYSWGLLQHGVTRERAPAVMHTLIYLGFLVLLCATTMVFIHHDLGIEIYVGHFYLAITLLSDLFGLGLLIGLMLAAKRRYLQRPDFLHNRSADAILLISLGLMCVQGFLLEGLRIHATDDRWALFSPVGLAVSRFFWGLSPANTLDLHFFVWWFHTLTVFAAIALAPYSKLLHIIASSANLFFRSSSRPKGALSSPGDIEKLIERGEEFSIGLSSIKDYSWKQRLELEACTSCGRCQDNCPAYGSGKPLSPKWLILDTRNHMLGLSLKDNTADATGRSSIWARLLTILKPLDSLLLRNFFFSSSGLEPQPDGTLGYKLAGRWRGENPAVQQSALAIAKNSDARIAGDVMSQDVFWSCTTCGACVEACPVGIDHVEQIIGNRRNLTLMQGSLPSEAQRTLRSLESQANPYAAAEERVLWLDGLEVPILKPGDQVDYLYWVGCVSAFDPRKQKIARALVTLMKAANLSFGILGSAEGCSGDPARRLGEENLFQTLAKRNLEVLRSVRFKTLVANCPHCFNTIKNEYPQLGNLSEGQSVEILHHSQLLKRLLAEGKLQINQSADTRQVTFHDPCYLGRFNDEYEAPRATLKQHTHLKIVEMDRSKEKSMCCGAGGGHFWMDLKLGERINVQRVEQAAQTGASTIATACPFCMQMLEDGIKLSDREASMNVQDIAEFMAQNLVSAQGKGPATL
jgi:Fe-S oxidoreductase